MEPRSARRNIAIVLILLLVAAAAMAYFCWIRPDGMQRAKNESQAADALRRLALAEADFRANDVDRNGVNDFWTADVAGLQRYGLIEGELARADASPVSSGLLQPIPYHGYLLVALQVDETTLPPEDYRQDTDGKSGKVHHRSQFAFLAYPAEWGVTGHSMLMINENNTVFRTFSWDGGPPRAWPEDRTLVTYWHKFCD